MAALSARSGALILGILALPAVLYASAHPVRWVWSVPNWEISWRVPSVVEETQSDPPFTDPGDYQQFHFPSWVTPALLALLGLLAAFLLARLALTLWRAAREARRGPIPEQDELEPGASARASALTVHQLSDAITEAIRRLDQPAVPDDAIISAWVSFEQAAARLGIERPGSWTPTEFITELLTRSDVPGVEAETLRRLYSQARFSPIPTTASDVRRARDCLTRIAPTLMFTPVVSGADGADS